VDLTLTVDGEVVDLDDYTYGKFEEFKSGDLYVTHY
jgi:hypothetical protein